MLILSSSVAIGFFCDSQHDDCRYVHCFYYHHRYCHQNCILLATTVSTMVFVIVLYSLIVVVTYYIMCGSYWHWHIDVIDVAAVVVLHCTPPLTLWPLQMFDSPCYFTIAYSLPLSFLKLFWSWLVDGFRLVYLTPTFGMAGWFFGAKLPTRGQHSHCVTFGEWLKRTLELDGWTDQLYDS